MELPEQLKSKTLAEIEEWFLAAMAAPQPPVPELLTDDGWMIGWSEGEPSCLRAAARPFVQASSHPRSLPLTSFGPVREAAAPPEKGSDRMFGAFWDGRDGGLAVH